MSRVLVVGADPGPIPGIVALAYSGGRPLVAPSVFQCDARSAPWLVRESLGSELPWDVVVLATESFVVRHRASRSSTPEAGRITRDLIGALSAVGTALGARVIQRSASQVKPWATDKRLDAAGLLDATKGMRHARDGARHALFAAVNDCGIPDPLSKAAVL